MVCPNCFDFLTVEYIWGCIKTRYLFRRWAPCRQEVWFFQLLWVWKHPWSSLVSFCIIVLSFCICFLSFCLHVLSCSVATMLRIKDTGLQKLICSNWLGVNPPKRSRFFHIWLSLLLSFSYRFGGLCRLPSSRVMNLYKLVIVFSGPVMHWTVLRCKPS